ncbi:peroxide stress protein YaaA [Clostridium beijerinckii]|uniref:peroxide stress protein YaaA n=1 Tax=Clostridium beijerinckii TaxID=1520 RepID=UPI0022E00F6F|nr:peroxide stress protein YaaA [Clostridium beijerinckii]
MMIIISPAKTLDFSKFNETLPMTKPYFLNEARELVEELKKYDNLSLEKLMKISPKLAKLNTQRFQNWSESLESARQCLIAFKGEVFKGLDVGSYTMEDYFYANDNLRILSGLYGVLKPFDGINLYRLEMATNLGIGALTNLYDYWGNKLIDNILKDIKRRENKTIVNLASYEYFKAIEDIKTIGEIRVITPIFKEYRDGEYKIITIMAKRARGLMTSFIIRNKIEDLEDLKEFNHDGYEFNEEFSNEAELVFTRDIHNRN